MPIDAIITIVAALIAVPIAWAATRTSDPSRPGAAVRIYMQLFRVSAVPPLQKAAAARTLFPRREAFLATWFISFFLLFGIGIFVWPGPTGS